MTRRCSPRHRAASAASTPPRSLFAGLGPVLWIVYACSSRRRSRCGGRWPRSAHRRAHARRVAVVDRGLWTQGNYGLAILRYTETDETVARTPRPRPRCCAASATGSSTAATARALDRAERRVHPAPLADRCRLPPRARLAARRRRAALAAPRLLRRAPRRRHADRGRRAPVRPPSPFGDLQAFADTDPGSRCARRPGPCRSSSSRWPCCSASASPPGRSPVGARRSASVPRHGGRGRGGQPAAAVHRARWSRDNLQRPEDVPAYWQQDADSLARRATATRVLEVPGIDFARYRWGNTVDPITPGLIDRPYVARELIPYGSRAVGRPAQRVRRRLQEGSRAPSLAPFARAHGRRRLNLRSDLQYERYRTPRPRTCWQQLDATPRARPAARSATAVPNTRRSPSCR